MKTIFAIFIVVIAVPICFFFYKNGLTRSKSNKTSLFGSFNGEYREDKLGKMTPSALEGLEEGQRKKAERESVEE